MQQASAVEDIGGNIATGATWMVASRFVARILGTVSTIVLARVLVPEDFGLVAMAMMIVALLELLSSFGFDSAIIQKQKTDPAYYDSAWTLNALLGVVKAALLAALAFPAAWFFGEPRLAPVMWFLCAAVLFQGLENVGMVEFRTRFQFDKEFRFLFAKKLVGVLVTVPLALLMRSYWALVSGMVISAGFGAALSYRVHSYRPRFMLEKAAELMGFSKWMLANNVLFFANHKLPEFIVGRVLGAHALGIYGIGLEVASLPSSELAAPVNRALFPGYARMSGDVAVLRKGLMNMLSATALVIIPAGVGIALVAEPLVAVLFGSEWSEAVPVMRVLAMFGIAQVFLNNAFNVNLAQANGRAMTLIAGIWSLITLAATLALVQSHQLLGVAWALTLSTVAVLPLSYGVLWRRLGLTAKELARAFVRPAVGTAGMVMALRCLDGDCGAGATPLVPAAQLALATGVGALTYGGLVLGLWTLSGRCAGPESWLVARLTQAWAGVVRA